MGEVWPISTPAGSVRINGVENEASLASIRIENRAIRRVGGLAAILVGSSRNNGLPSVNFSEHQSEQ